MDGIHHIAIVVREIDAALAFYRDALGLEVAERRDVPEEGVEIAMLPTGGGAIELMRPLDEEMILRFARKGRVILTVEEGVTAGGFGSAVRELLDREKKFEVRFKSIGIPLEIYPLGKADKIKKKFQLDEKGLIQQIKEFYGVAS